MKTRACIYENVYNEYYLGDVFIVSVGGDLSII